MRHAVRITLAAAALLAARVAHAQCSATPAVGEYWTVTFVDSGTRVGRVYDTTYTLTAPCKVIIDTDFVVTARAVDHTYTVDTGDTTIGKLWSINDWAEGGTTIAMSGDASGMIIPTTGGEWVQAVTTAYHGTPVNHVISFSFIPGGNATQWAPVTVLSALTVDPYPDTTTAPPDPSGDPTTAPTPDPTPDPTTAGTTSAGPRLDPTGLASTVRAAAAAGGCSSAGAAGALALLGALALRRTRRR